MSINGFDHVNLRTSAMAATVDFYAAVLDLTPGPPPPGLDPQQITWMRDAAGRALFHLMRAPDGTVSDTTGAIDHIALDSSGYDAMIERLTTLGVAHRCNDVASIDLRQIFVRDPNGVLLELNFRTGQH